MQFIAAWRREKPKVMPTMRWLLCNTATRRVLNPGTLLQDPLISISKLQVLAFAINIPLTISFIHFVTCFQMLAQSSSRQVSQLCSGCVEPAVIYINRSRDPWFLMNRPYKNTRSCTWWNIPSSSLIVQEPWNSSSSTPSRAEFESKSWTSHAGGSRSCLLGCVIFRWYMHCSEEQ